MSNGFYKLDAKNQTIYAQLNCASKKVLIVENDHELYLFYKEMFRVFNKNSSPLYDAYLNKKYDLIVIKVCLSFMNNALIHNIKDMSPLQNILIIGSSNYYSSRSSIYVKGGLQHDDIN